jgi:hypothetical protein
MRATISVRTATSDPGKNIRKGEIFSRLADRLYDVTRFPEAAEKTGDFDKEPLLFCR